MNSHGDDPNMAELFDESVIMIDIFGKQQLASSIGLLVAA